ncbi:unnamed protein product [Moneuplotes crassus]|uniref:Uncharacterized protein n=1 Tax=Euplotes crassus TaxID=5936 RepID=A0AAD1UGW9_EUPCR|nr:unnamed protein product [Moneuplotes crassus]
MLFSLVLSSKEFQKLGTLGIEMLHCEKNIPLVFRQAERSLINGDRLIVTPLVFRMLWKHLLFSICTLLQKLKANDCALLGNEFQRKFLRAGRFSELILSTNIVLT